MRSVTFLVCGGIVSNRMGMNARPLRIFKCACSNQNSFLYPGLLGIPPKKVAICALHDPFHLCLLPFSHGRNVPFCKMEIQGWGNPRASNFCGVNLHRDVAEIEKYFMKNINNCFRKRRNYFIYLIYGRLRKDCIRSLCCFSVCGSYWRSKAR